MQADPPAQAPLRSVRKTHRAATIRTIGALVLREMSTTYGRSPGGYVWVVLEPILGIALLSYIFSLGFRTPRLGTNFPMFYATGLVPFTMFMDAANKVATSIMFSRALLNYPRVTFLDAMVSRLLLSILTQLLVFFIIITAIRTIWDTRTVLDISRAMQSVGMLFALAAGVGALNCFLFTMFPLWQRAWSILTRPLVILSGVFLLLESVPESAQVWMWYNPLIHITGEMRGAFYPEYEAAYVSPAFVYGTALILATTGLLFLRQYHRDMLER